MVIAAAASFQQLCEQAGACRRCPRLADKRAVLSPLNGTLTPRVVFIGEAPGRRGAERTRRPFTGDASGRRFDELLACAKLTRAEIFITNAVLCCPADEVRNHTPTPAEVSNCGSFLRGLLELLQPKVVASVGAVALRAVGLLYDQRWKLAEVAGATIALPGFTLVPLYHMSPRVLNSVRSVRQQRADFRRLGVVVRNGSAPPA